MREPAVCLISWPVGIGEGATLKIATFNINNVNRRLPNLLGWLKTAKPDIVCLQELKAEQSAFPLAAIEKAGYSAVWRGQKTWNGVAILAKRSEPQVTRTELPGDRFGRAKPLHRSRGWRHPDRLHLSAERQSTTGTEVRL
jgi:exonuclease III